MVIGIDIDDTLTNSFDYFQQFVAEYFGADIEELKQRNISAAYFPPEWKKDEVDFCKTYYDKTVLDTPFKPDAAWGVNKLRQLGHKIIIITARSPLFYDDPYEITAKELEKGNIIYDKLICTLDKAEACVNENVSVLIDDMPKNCNAVSERGVIPIMFNCKGNMNVETPFRRVSSWEEIIDIICGMQN